MSGEQSLPEELAQLEEELAARPLPEPPPGLRGRILAAVRNRAPAPSPVAVRGGLLPFAAAVAALLLVCMNLSMSAVNRTDWDVWGSTERVDVATQARELQQLLPDLPEGEASRIALVMGRRRPLLLVPEIKGGHAWPAAPGPTGTETTRRESSDGICTAVD